METVLLLLMAAPGKSFILFSNRSCEKLHFGLVLFGSQSRCLFTFEQNVTNKVTSVEDFQDLISRDRRSFSVVSAHQTSRKERERL